jgi:pectate lyase
MRIPLCLLAVLLMVLTTVLTTACPRPIEPAPGVAPSPPAVLPDGEGEGEGAGDGEGEGEAPDTGGEGEGEGEGEGPDTGGEGGEGEAATPVSCAGAIAAGWQVCDQTGDTCTVLFEDGAGCPAVCAGVGLACTDGYDNVGCGIDPARAPLGCGDTGHVSDVCVCGRNSDICLPASCAGRCGDVDDGCGGTLSCPASCPSGTCGDDGRCVVAVACAGEGCLAFPGAEGEGRLAAGGRGGDVCRVTSLANSGAGTLRECLTSGSGARTVVFETAGIIDLTSPLQAERNRLTIAGQTAPGDGITVRGFNVEIRGDDVIIQHLRFRAGDIRKKTSSRPNGFTEDCLTLAGDDVIVDHVSASWGIDENLSVGPDPFRRVTVQWSIIAEGLRRTGLFHGELDPNHQGHSMGSLFKSRSGNSTISVHHNLFANNNNRNPAIGTYNADQICEADLRNNVLSNNRNTGYVSGAALEVRVNYVGNFLQTGPDSSDRHAFQGNADSHVVIFQERNLRDLDGNSTVNGRDDGWANFVGDYGRRTTPHGLAPITTHDATTAHELVLTQSGARPWSRDSVDTRIVAGVRQGTGRIIDSQDEVGGWGTLRAGTRPTDSDRDGMDDGWEMLHGSRVGQADHNGDVDGDGYTNLENYLHHAARLIR